ncbi:MAG: biotin/lipoyl-binding protein [Bacteroidales bacterium]|nr:biotin/lipoyl-binding protein [Bacteroidales bacterium]
MSDIKPDIRTHYRQLYVKVEPGQIYAFIPGTIIDIFVKKGQKVKKGDPLFTLHAMKMDNELCSTIDGTIGAINIKAGQIVNKNDVLIDVIPLGVKIENPSTPKPAADKKETVDKKETADKKETKK